MLAKKKDPGSQTCFAEEISQVIKLLSDLIHVLVLFYFYFYSQKIGMILFQCFITIKSTPTFHYSYFWRYWTEI